MSSVVRKLFVVDGENLWLTEEEQVARGLIAAPVAAAPGVASGYSASRPGRSVAMSVHPDQAAMMNSEVRKLGISGVEYDSRGQCIITSRAGRRDLMKKASGLFTGIGNVHDGDGGYGD